MRLRDYFISKKKLLEQLRDAQRDAEVNALCLKSEQEEKERLFEELMTAQHSLEEVKQNVASQRNENQTLKTVLHTVQPKLQSMEEMRWFYNAISPALDPDGFQLHREAKEITGVDVCGFYPYEDNMGAFERMKGPQLMQYLEAAYFGAVKWEIVGSTYEKAVLLPVDTTTEAYRNYETRLYAKTLDRLGFEVSKPVQEHAQINRKNRGEER